MARWQWRCCCCWWWWATAIQGIENGATHSIQAHTHTHHNSYLAYTNIHHLTNSWIVYHLVYIGSKCMYRYKVAYEHKKYVHEEMCATKIFFNHHINHVIFMFCYAVCWRWWFLVEWTPNEKGAHIFSINRPYFYHEKMMNTNLNVTKRNQTKRTRKTPKQQFNNIDKMSEIHLYMHKHGASEGQQKEEPKRNKKAKQNKNTMAMHNII